jgi:curli biogenesis system outer membrane secretion channel CsgG
MPDFGSSEKVSTQSTGYGTTLSAAVDDAIRNAIRQVNGQTVDASTESFQQAIAVSIGEGAIQLSSAGFAQMIATHSKGAVTDFELISQEKLKDNSFKAAIKANVAKFKKPESANLVRIVVAPIRVQAAAMIVGNRRIDPNTIAASLHASVSDALGQTQRFTVLDREFSSDIDSELAFIESGKVANEDFARLGQALATDLIWIGTLDQFNYVRHDQKLLTSDRTLVSYSGGAVLNYRLVNMTTRQVVLGDKVQVELPNTEPTTLAAAIDENRVIADLSRQLSELASQAVVTKFFPITVVALQGDDVILSQGGKVIQTGKRYHVYQLGDELKDPQSGRSLGRTELECCVVEVNRVTPDMAYGRLIDKKITLPVSLIPGSLEVREEVSFAKEAISETEKEVTAASKATSSSAAAIEHKLAPQPSEKTKSPNVDKDW